MCKMLNDVWKTIKMFNKSRSMYYANSVTLSSPVFIRSFWKFHLLWNCEGGCVS